MTCVALGATDGVACGVADCAVATCAAVVACGAAFAGAAAETEFVGSWTNGCVAGCFCANVYPLVIPMNAVVDSPTAKIRADSAGCFLRIGTGALFVTVGAMVVSGVVA